MTKPATSELLDAPILPSGAAVGSTDWFGFPPVLDVCCGPRMMWYDKQNPRALYMDRRDEEIETPPNAAYKHGKTFRIRPDVKASFDSMPFPDETFWHIVFDPPHLLAIDDARALMRVQYGQLFPGWQDMIRAGFEECFRVMKPNGTLIFKWCEYEIPLSEVICLSPIKPLYGHRTGKKALTHWCAFLKPNDPSSATRAVGSVRINKPPSRPCPGHPLRHGAGRGRV